MSRMSESAKRDFISQLILLIEENASLLVDQGFEPTAKLDALKQVSEVAEHKETIQQDMQAKAKEATTESRAALKEAYEKASATVELMAGFLGKNHPLVKQIRLMRK